jgi:hypothetical protein
MKKLYTTLKEAYNLGNQYVQDFHKLANSDDGFEYLWKNTVQSNGQLSTNVTIMPEDFFKNLDPQNKAFRKYQSLQESDIGLESIIFGRGMRKDKKKFEYLTK